MILVISYHMNSEKGPPKLTAYVFLRDDYLAVHAYFEIGHDILWDTVKQNLPPLIHQ